MNSLISKFFDPQTLIWVAQILYFICFIPQIWINYKLKSGRGLNDLFLLAYLNTMLSLLFYAFCIGLPAAYKFMYPLQTFAVLILIFQRLFYDKFSYAKYYWFLYFINLAIPATLIPYAVANYSITGNITGWIFLSISLVNQLPLVAKIASSKSVKGISFDFLLITGIAGVIEFYVALRLGLPIQTIFGSARVIAFFIIFCVQFLLYKNSKSNA